MDSIPFEDLFDDLNKGLTEDLFASFLNTDLLDAHPSSLPQVTDELLYQERLQALIDSQLRDIETFSR